MDTSQSMSGIEYIDSNNMIVVEGISNSSNTESDSIRSDVNTFRPSNLEVASHSAGSSGVVTNKRPRKPNPTTPLAYVGFETHGGAYNRVFSTPNGNKFYKPDVPAEFEPPVGTAYASWEDVVTMYVAYAKKAGFMTKHGTHKYRPTTTSYRFMHCKRYGKTQLGDFSMANCKNKRSTRIKKTNCMACIRLKVLPGTSEYILYEWHELLNHPLIGQEFMDFSSDQRAITYTEQHLIHSLSMHNIGPVRAHKANCSLKGGHQFVRGKGVDYKNFYRDIRLFIRDRDAQLTVDTLVARTENLHNFYFDHKVVNDEVRGLFWADDVSRCHYDEFGDVLAFDATYKTNKYKMIFVPFTGVDHHTKCVTFGAGLICDETIESYLWLLENFLKAHTKQPRLVLTDQDSSMRRAVLKVFHKSSHRLCMWHIVMKIPVKLKGSNVDNEQLKKGISNLVWDLQIEPDDFEQRWTALMEEYNLTDHEWLGQMYAIRRRWVPCYFKHLDMCCLMKTTSRCESTNAMFKVNTNKSNTLLQFLMCFDTAIDGQRHKQRELEFGMMTTTAVCVTPLRIERHASEIYTPALFRLVQKEIDRGFLHCSTSIPTVIGSVKLYNVVQYNQMLVPVCNFEVTFDIRDKTTLCTCNLFRRIGYLCRHIFAVFRLEQVHAIPDQYVPKRWSRDSLPRRVYDISNRYSVDNRVETRLRNEILDTVGLCTDRLRRNPIELSALCDQVKALKIKIFAEVPYDPDCHRTTAVISDLLHVPETGTATLIPPQSIRTKGCGNEKDNNTDDNSGKRFVGEREKAITRLKKGKVPRLCGKCKKYVTDHNAGTCDKVHAQKAAAAAKARAAKSSAAAHATATETFPADGLSSLTDDARTSLDVST
ncbi:hypothetical protein SSX86_031680 [Deinandra increscens subsp. villosa]|uniref:SWIM-type domain-containing protein n=1 Tax=Deinandra increscens subsp. villosa TaxID=3103831 RepID=A0AAP0GIL6_9ASTR